MVEPLVKQINGDMNAMKVTKITITQTL